MIIKSEIKIIIGNAMIAQIRRFLDLKHPVELRVYYEDLLQLWMIKWNGGIDESV